MSRMPPISCLGSAPLMIFSWPAASISAIQLRRSLLGTAMSPNSAHRGHRQTGDDIVVHDAGIVGQNIALAPTVGHQADHELDGKPGAADHGFAGENVRIECNARMLGHQRLSPKSFFRSLNNHLPSSDFTITSR